MTADGLAVRTALLALERFLHRYKVPYEPVVRELREQIEMDEGATLSAELVTEVRGMFGGMASLNDVFISKVNGHQVEDEDDANRRLEALRTESWDLVANAEDEPTN